MRIGTIPVVPLKLPIRTGWGILGTLMGSTYLISINIPVLISNVLLSVCRDINSESRRLDFSCTYSFPEVFKYRKKEHRPYPRITGLSLVDPTRAFQ